jgi:hypothetical protein
MDVEELELPVVTLQEDYESDLRRDFYEAPSDFRSLSGAFSNAITSRISHQIQEKVIRVGTSHMVNKGIHGVLEESEKAIRRMEDEFCEEGAKYYYGNKEKFLKLALDNQQQAHEEDPAYQQQREDIKALEAQLKQIEKEKAHLEAEVVAGSADYRCLPPSRSASKLQEKSEEYEELKQQYQEKNEALQQHPLYPSSERLGRETERLRDEAEKAGRYKEADRLDKIRQPLRKLHDGAATPFKRHFLKRRALNWGLVNDQEGPRRFSNLKEAQQAAQDFRKKWENASLEKRLALEFDEEYRAVLGGIEALEKSNKASYRRQRRGAMLEDIEGYSPGWEKMKKERQEETKAQTNALRELREQIITEFRPEGELLRSAGIKGEYNSDGVWACDSSEDEQWVSRETSRTYRNVGRYGLQIGASVGATAMGGPGAGFAAFKFTGIVLDPELHTALQEGDLGGTLNNLTYHAPLLGPVRGVWDSVHAACDAWGEGDYIGAAGHTGNAVLQVTSFKADAKLGLVKGKKVTRKGKVKRTQKQQGGKRPKSTPGIMKVAKEVRKTKTIKGVSKLSKTIQLTETELQRVQNAANRIGKPIYIVGSRAHGTAKVTSDFDYVIEGISSKKWNKIKNSPPGAPSRIDNLPRRIDLF